MLSLDKCVKAWDKFFFEEKSTEGLALFRMIWFGITFIYYLFDTGNIADFYGPEAIVSLSTVRAQFPYLHLNIFHFFHSQYEVSLGIFILYGVTLLTSMIGLFTRYSIIAALILMTSLHQRNIWMLSSAELLVRTITLYLAFSPCGHSFSVDAYLGRFFKKFRKKRIWPVWSLRLIQIQLSVVYLWTFWHKIKGDTWFDGTAVYYATRLESMTNFPVPYFLDSVPFLKLATWGTLILEFGLGVLIWFKEFRKPLIVLGILFHLGIEYSMSIPYFEFYMMSLLINFFTPEELSSFILLIKQKLFSFVPERTIKPIRG